MGFVSDVQTYLEAEGVVGGSSGWTSLRRRILDDVDKIVVFSEDGGLEPEQPAAEGIGDNATTDPAVLVYVRGGPWDGDSASTKALAIFDALHGQRNAAIGASTYIRVQARTSEPVFLGFDERGRPELTISFRGRKLLT